MPTLKKIGQTHIFTLIEHLKVLRKKEEIMPTRSRQEDVPAI